MLSAAMFLVVATVAPANEATVIAALEAASPEVKAPDLTGRDIYQRVLDNRYQRGVQKVRITSTDPGGSAQITELTASLEDLRNEEGEPTKGVIAKLLIGITSPFDMRHTAYLMITRDPGPDDEFIYKPRILKFVDHFSDRVFLVVGREND